MGHADVKRTAEPLKEPDASGVHISKEPTSEAAWKELLAPGGELDPPVEALLNAFMRLRRRHDALVRNAEALSSALERVPLGLAVLVNGHLVVANREAYRLIDGSGLRRTVEDEIVARDPEVQRALLEALSRLEHGTTERSALVVPREGGTLQVVLTLGGPSLPDSIVVALADPETNPTTDPEGYRRLYNLTPTEAKVAVQLVLGRSPREIAEHLGVGVETTRTHVKHILHKMGCHRQVDVVRRLVTGPTSLR